VQPPRKTEKAPRIGQARPPFPHDVGPGMPPSGCGATRSFFDPRPTAAFRQQLPAPAFLTGARPLCRRLSALRPERFLGSALARPLLQLAPPSSPNQACPPPRRPLPGRGSSRVPRALPPLGPPRAVSVRSPCSALTVPSEAFQVGPPPSGAGSGGLGPTKLVPAPLAGCPSLQPAARFDRGGPCRPCGRRRLRSDGIRAGVPRRICRRCGIVPGELV